jgi:hypothetical protein
MRLIIIFLFISTILNSQSKSNLITKSYSCYDCHDSKSSEVSWTEYFILSTSDVLKFDNCLDQECKDSILNHYYSIKIENLETTNGVIIPKTECLVFSLGLDKYTPLMFDRSYKLSRNKIRQIKDEGIGLVNQCDECINNMSGITVKFYYKNCLLDSLSLKPNEALDSNFSNLLEMCTSIELFSENQCFQGIGLKLFLGTTVRKEQIRID